MSATVLYMSISLDEFVAEPNEGPDDGLGDGGHRLKAESPARDAAIDTTLIPPRTQYGAKPCKAEKRNRLRYADFASPCNPLQHLNYHS